MTKRSGLGAASSTRRGLGVDAHGRAVTTRISEADAQSGAGAVEGGIVGEAEILAGREQRHVPRLPFKAHAAEAAPDIGLAGRRERERLAERGRIDPAVAGPLRSHRAAIDAGREL